MNMKKLAANVAMAMSLAVGMSVLPSNGAGTVNLAEARSDHYVGYDDYMDADMYIDTDSVKSWGTNRSGRVSDAIVHWPMEIRMSIMPAIILLLVTITSQPVLEDFI